MSKIKKWTFGVTGSIGYKKVREQMKIKTCPSCGSVDIHLHLGGVTGVKYKCKTCGYIGPLIVERDIDKKFLKTGFMKAKAKR